MKQIWRKMDLFSTLRFSKDQAGRSGLIVKNKDNMAKEHKLKTLYLHCMKIRGSSTY